VQDLPLESITYTAAHLSNSFSNEFFFQINSRTMKNSYTCWFSSLRLLAVVEINVTQVQPTDQKPYTESPAAVG